MTDEKKNQVGSAPATLGELNASPRNPRKISGEALAALKVGLASYGDLGGIVVNVATGELVSGHQRVRALKAMYGELPIVDGAIRTPDGQSYPVRMVEWDEARALGAMVTANNVHAQGEFTDDLGALLKELKAGDAELFASLELGKLELDEGEDGECDPDEGPEQVATLAATQRGDLWELGEHRLLCGDSTSAADVARLMDGQRAALFATDPPYLVGYDGSNHYTSPKDHSATYGVTWDDAEQGPEFYAAFCAVAMEHAVREDAAWYCWHASVRQAMLEGVWAALGILAHQQIIWVKDRPVLTRSDFLWGHEPCFYGWKKGHRAKWVGAEKPSTVWRIEAVRTSLSALHPTSKPVELFSIPMRQHTAPGEVCYEPFAGSGSQVIAAELNGRRCFAMEISPEYCDVVVARWCKFTGRGRVLRNGAPFEWAREAKR